MQVGPQLSSAQRPRAQGLGKKNPTRAIWFISSLQTAGAEQLRRSSPGKIHGWAQPPTLVTRWAGQKALLLQGKSRPGGRPHPACEAASSSLSSWLLPSQEHCSLSHRNKYIQPRGATVHWSYLLLDTPAPLGPCTRLTTVPSMGLHKAGQKARGVLWMEVRSSRTTAAFSPLVTWSGNQSYVSNWVKRSLISGATCRAAFAASVIAFRYIPFFLRLNLSLKNSEKGESFEIDKNDVVGDPNHETFASCQEGSPSSFWPRLMSRTRAGHQGKP